MSTFVTNDENFDKDISSQKVPVIVDFGAEWCGPCKQLDPILEQIAQENTDKLKEESSNSKGKGSNGETCGDEFLLLPTSMLKLPSPNLDNVSLKTSNWIESFGSASESANSRAQNLAVVEKGLEKGAPIIMSSIPSPFTSPVLAQYPT